MILHDTKTLSKIIRKCIGKKWFTSKRGQVEYKYRFVWSKKDCYVANKTNYRLVFTRTLKRELAKRIKSGEYEYFTI